jgi:hypothetical protein
MEVSVRLREWGITTVRYTNPTNNMLAKIFKRMAVEKKKKKGVQVGLTLLCFYLSDHNLA